jgi:hypothetical protein
MINSNNNISGVIISGTFSGDGSGLTGLPSAGGGSGLPYPTFPIYTYVPNGADAFWRPVIFTSGYSLSSKQYNANTLSLHYFQVPENLTLTDMRVRTASTSAGNTMSLGIYSFGNYSTGGVTYSLPTTLQYTMSTNISLTTSGTKTISSLNFKFDPSLTVDNLWAVGFLPTANVNVSTYSPTSAFVMPPFYTVLDSAGTIYRGAGYENINIGATSSLPSSLSNTNFSGINGVTDASWVLVKLNK